MKNQVTLQRQMVVRVPDGLAQRLRAVAGLGEFPSLNNMCCHCMWLRVGSYTGSRSKPADRLAPGRKKGWNRRSTTFQGGPRCQIKLVVSAELYETTRFVCEKEGVSLAELLVSGFERLMTVHQYAVPEGGAERLAAGRKPKALSPMWDDDPIVILDDEFAA